MEAAPTSRPATPQWIPSSPARTRTAVETIVWASDRFGDGLVLSTSFGIQSAVMLHLATQVKPDMPVVWVDTGYLSPETYRFAEQLRGRLGLNLTVYQSPLSAARMEALHGRLWEGDDLESLNRYNRIRKVEPMQRALGELGATAWLSGLRADQTDHRKTLQVVGWQNERAKILPILDWTARDIHQYLTANDLPYHPLFEQGYAHRRRLAFEPTSDGRRRARTRCALPRTEAGVWAPPGRTR
jgi:phosphoadenosine phosphosulfate reductase